VHGGGPHITIRPKEFLCFRLQSDDKSTDEGFFFLLFLAHDIPRDITQQLTGKQRGTLNCSQRTKVKILQHRDVRECLLIFPFPPIPFPTF